MICDPLSVNPTFSDQVSLCADIWYIRLHIVVYSFLCKKTAILTLSSSTAASWQLCIFRRRISLLGMLFYAVFYAAIFAK